MEEENILFIRLSDHIIQIDTSKYNKVNDFMAKLIYELLFCDKEECIEKIMVTKKPLTNW